MFWKSGDLRQVAKFREKQVRIMIVEMDDKVMLRFTWRAFYANRVVIFDYVYTVRVCVQRNNDIAM